MAKLKYIETDRANLPEFAIVGGQVLHCLDTGEIFFDNANTVRVLTELVILVDSIKSVTSPLRDRLYIDRHAYVDENGLLKHKDPEFATMYKLNEFGIWEQVLDSIEVSFFLSSYVEMEPAILNEEGRNKAPATLARYVYTDDGANVQDLLNQIIIPKSAVVSFTIDGNEHAVGTTYNATLPFENYFSNSNSAALVFLNGKILSDIDYKFINENIVFTNELILNDVITIVYIYQANAGKDNKDSVLYTDGNYILDKSVSRNKLAKTTDSYMIDDTSVIPSAKALYDSHRTLIQKINAIDPTSQIYTADSSSHNYEIVLLIRNYQLQDCSTITLRTRYDIGTDCDVRINNFDPVPLYTNVGTPIKEGVIKAGQVITIRYNAQDEVFYIVNPDFYKVIKDRFDYFIDGVNITAPILKVPIGFEDYNPVYDVIDVYYENIRLFKDINYDIGNGFILLKGFSASEGERFILERTRVVASNL